MSEAVSTGISNQSEFSLVDIMVGFLSLNILLDLYIRLNCYKYLNWLTVYVITQSQMTQKHAE